MIAVRQCELHRNALFRKNTLLFAPVAGGKDAQEINHVFGKGEGANIKTAIFMFGFHAAARFIQ